MNSFDSSVLLSLNKFVNISPRFDSLVNAVSSSDLLKGGAFMACVWLFWFLKSDEKEQTAAREKIVSNLFACFLAVALARVLAHILPFRLRPLHVPELHFIIPYEMDPNTLLGWSSFPSDHAVLFFGLATGIFCLSRIAGALAYVYVVLVICLPRVYLGIHYPTDIVAGAALGIAIAWIADAEKIRKSVAKPALYYLQRAPGSFYPLLFVLTFQIATLFNDLRHIVRYFGWAFLKSVAP